MIVLDFNKFDKLPAILNPLKSIFEKHGLIEEIRIVGGAVRDLLSGKKPEDFDFATTLTPEQMKDIFDEENIRMINTKGEKHGTITIRIGDNNYEITTLRRDDVTDGRHAEVSFTTEWEIDAARRDLTVNSMYLDFDGKLYDYFNGAEDLKQGRIVFVGEPSTRIKEDYLRILRYFRFYGRLANTPSNHDPYTIEAICNNISGLEKISGERIWSELRRIVYGNFAEEIVEVMLNKCKIGLYIGLPSFEELDWSLFASLYKHRRSFDDKRIKRIKPISYIAALLRNENEVLKFHNRVKLSSAERDVALFIVKHKDELPTDNSLCLKHFQKMTIFSKNEAITQDYILQLLKVLSLEDVLREFVSWKRPVFHVNGNTLKSEGIEGKRIKVVLDELLNLWVDENFFLSDHKMNEVIAKYKTDQTLVSRVCSCIQWFLYFYNYVFLFTLV